MELSVYDIEVLKNCFCVCLYNVRTQKYTKFEISERVNQYKEMRDHFLTPNMYFVGFNSLSYDGPIMSWLINNYFKLQDSDAMVVTMEAFRLSDDIINGEGESVRYLMFKPAFKQIDLLTMLFSKALRVSLKEMEITMCYKNVQEMDHHWNELIQADKIDELISYCFNDVGATSKLLGLCINDLKLRLAIEEEFNIPCLSKDGVGIGVEIFTKFICEDMHIDKRQLLAMVKTPKMIAVKDLIVPIVEFKTDKFKGILNWFRSINISTDDALSEVDGELTDEKKKYKRKVLFNNLVHTFALGGLHSENRPAVHVSDSKYTIRDVDVASYYPSLIIEWEIAPKYIKEPFLRVIKLIKELRMVAKRAKSKNKDLTFKLAMNALSGNFKNRYSAFFSPESNLSMCINGQLMLAMLIEDMELAKFECIASNTDGATFKVQNGREEEFRRINAEWEKKTRMVLEETVYEKMVIYAVNDYIAYKEGYSAVKDQLFFHDPEVSIKLNEVPVKLLNDPISQMREKYVKEKGMFITSPRLGKGLDALITSKALQDYYGKATPIRESVTNSKYIWDFIKFERVGKQYDVVWNEISQQRTNRFYVSKRGAYLMKVKDVEKFDKNSGMYYTVKSKQHLLQGYGVQVMNKYEEKSSIEEYDINYQYYINQCNAIIRKIEPEQQSLFELK